MSNEEPFACVQNWLNQSVFEIVRIFKVCCSLLRADHCRGLIV